MHIIPAIDIIEGKAVRLTQGDYAQKTVYNANPTEVAKAFEDAGLSRLHLVDLDGAKAKKIINWKVLENITRNTKLWVDFGGGVQSDDDLKIALESGAKQITGGSIAVKNPEMFEGWLGTFGSEKLILGADARNERVAVGGWEEATALYVYDFIETWASKGMKYVISTDVAKDGLLQGPSFELYEKIQAQTPDIQVIASGGISCMDDLHRLSEQKIFGVIVGKAIYEGRITLKELATFSS